ncbi:EF-hand domain-containing protein 1-like [Pollicipes pollicipes]|uniref:EF-hand domain-containing protein 1-like n=1 Tax=Pollicipes pollicipes TaxID=41117 RepID=UPI00188587E7|nr:EF-hand domain-containing protein 1-like [Pollicipes pollicipes]
MLQFSGKDPTKIRFGRSQLCGFKNGYNFVGHGGPLSCADSAPGLEGMLDELADHDPILTYGDPKSKRGPKTRFVPSYVAYDKKVLKFLAYFKQKTPNSQEEKYRIRYVHILYFLEDDTICIMEPNVDNSGIPQGKLLRRHRVPKNDAGEYYHWRDFDVQDDVCFYGLYYHIYDCDPFTRQLYESEGIDLRAADESTPDDPYIHDRKMRLLPHTYVTPPQWDKLRQFLHMDRKVLRFYVVCDDRDELYGELRKYILLYYLADDTIEILEVHKKNDGRDPFPCLLRRQKVPKKMHHSLTFPSINLEVSPTEVKEWFLDTDLKVGGSVCIFNKRFLLYDCDEFTKNYYRENYCITDFTPVDVSRRAQGLEKKVARPPPNPEPLVLKTPEKDYMKYLENDGIILRFEAELESQKPYHRERRFIISYYPSDDTISIYERVLRNSGVIGGKFLHRMMVEKPESTKEDPVYFTLRDFCIGTTLQVYNHRFKIVNADRFVLTFLEANPCGLEGTIANLNQFFQAHPAPQPVCTSEEQAESDERAPAGGGGLEVREVSVMPDMSQPEYRSPMEKYLDEKRRTEVEIEHNKARAEGLAQTCSELKQKTLAPRKVTFCEEAVQRCE